VTEDEDGNVMSDSFFVEHGPDTIQDVIKELGDDPQALKALTAKPQFQDFSAELRADIHAWLADRGL
jgi:hypothetical protein